jgi:hypothetical protein
MHEDTQLKHLEIVYKIFCLMLLRRRSEALRLGNLSIPNRYANKEMKHHFLRKIRFMPEVICVRACVRACVFVVHD